jgi:HEAT repeat protein
VGKYIKMKKIISIFLPLILVGGILFSQEEGLSSEGKSKKGGLFGKKSKDETPKKDIILIKDPYTADDLNKIKSEFNSEKSGSLELLIEIYKDKNQILQVRLEALNTLSTSKDPTLKMAILETISDSDFLEMEIMKKALKILIGFNSPESTAGLIEGLSNSEMQIMDLRAEIIESIGENNSEDKVITLLELYEISLKNHQRMNELLTLSLGELDDDRAIPLLMDIARNDEIDLHIRNRAVEILSRKNAPELVDFFVEMLGSPGSNDQMLNFVNNSMGIVERDRLLMALLESYQIGKNRYYAVLHSIMGSLEDYSNPEIKPVFIEVAKTDGFPRLLRIKAIQSN